MPKLDSYERLENLLESRSTDFIIRLIANWFSSNELAEFVEFVENEV